jgi:hypothetical protein
VAPEYIEEMEREYGKESDIYKVRVLGEFPSGGDLQFIPADLAEAAASRYHRESAWDFAPVVLGVDVAWFGGDKSVVYLRQGIYSRKLFSVQGCEIATFAGVVARLEDAHKADAVFVDSTGVGAGVVSNLRMMGRAPIAVSYSGKPIAPEYHNKRAECWGLLKKWLSEDQGWIPDDQHLKDDLCAPDYGYDMAGRLILERKEEMKRRGLASPDDADALALTFAAPVAPRQTWEERAIEAIAGRDKPYDPFRWKRKKR